MKKYYLDELSTLQLVARQIETRKLSIQRVYALRIENNKIEKKDIRPLQAEESLLLGTLDDIKTDIDNLLEQLKVEEN